MQVEDGPFEHVGAAGDAVLCWDGDTTDWSEPEPTSFD